MKKGKRVTSDEDVEKLVYDETKKTNKITIDGHGLYLIIGPLSKTWTVQYRFKGKQTQIRLGQYPSVTYVDAVKEATEIKRQLADGKNPIELRRQAEEAAQREKEDNERTVKVIYCEWREKKVLTKSPNTDKAITSIFKLYILPAVGDTPVSQVTLPLLREITEGLEKKTLFNAAHKTAQFLRMFFAYCVACEYIQSNPAENLRQTLREKPKTVHRAADTSIEGVRDMLNRLDDYRYFGCENPYLMAAFLVLIYTGKRANEVCGAKWSEFDLERAVWTIPENRMKARKEHTVYLSTQCMSILRKMYDLKQSEFVFYSTSKSGHIVERSLRNLQEQANIPLEKMSRHGWRSVLKSLAMDSGAPWELTELALSHEIEGLSSRAYSRGQLENRLRHFWQWYADSLDQLLRKGEFPLWQ